MSTDRIGPVEIYRVWNSLPRGRGAVYGNKKDLEFAQSYGVGEV
jgi:hypothetical protein